MRYIEIKEGQLTITENKAYQESGPQTVEDFDWLYRQYPDNEEYIEISMDTGNVEQIEATLRHLLKETRFYEGLDDILDNWEDIRTGSFDDVELLGDKTKTTCCAILSSINPEASSALSMYFYSTRLGPKDEKAFDLIEKNHLKNKLPIVVEKMKLEGIIEKSVITITNEPSNKHKI